MHVRSMSSAAKIAAQAPSFLLASVLAADDDKLYILVRFNSTVSRSTVPGWPARPRSSCCSPPLRLQAYSWQMAALLHAIASPGLSLRIVSNSFKAPAKASSLMTSKVGDLLLPCCSCRMQFSCLG